MTFYQLKPRLPGGTWLAIFLLIAGSVMLVLSLVLAPSTALRIAGTIVAILGLALLVVTIVAMRRQWVLVTFDEEGYTVDGPLGEFCGSWIDVTDVSVSRKTAKIALWHGRGRRTIIAHPARVMDDDFMRIRQEIRDHLDALDNQDGSWG
jgi:membrane-bound ClpP family serine protease